MKNVIVATSSLSYIDEEKGILFYCGYPIEVLVEKLDYEEVCFLLLNRRLPTKKSLGIQREAGRGEGDSPQVIDLLKALPKTTRPMDALRTGVSALSGFDPLAQSTKLEDNYEMAIKILVKALRSLSNSID